MGEFTSNFTPANVERTVRGFEVFELFLRIRAVAEFLGAARTEGETDNEGKTAPCNPLSDVCKRQKDRWRVFLRDPVA
jgi:hypothetical protein